MKTDQVGGIEMQGLQQKGAMMMEILWMSQLTCRQRATILQCTYMYIRESHTYLLQYFGDVLKVYELKDDGGDSTSCLYTPVLIKGI